MAQLPISTLLPLPPSTPTVENLTEYISDVAQALQQRIDDMTFYYNDTVTNFNTTDNVRPTLPQIDEVFAWDSATDRGFAAVNGVWIPITGLTGAPASTTAATYNATVSNGLILADCTSNAITVNLPTAASAQNKQLIIVKVDASANAVTVDANGAQTISGNLTFTIAAQWGVLHIISDGANWVVIT